MPSQILLIVVALTGFLTVVNSAGQYGDVRCKCVCPPLPLPNSTETSQKVYTESFNEPGRCKCENVVNRQLIEKYENFCARCECQWQRRNTTTIKVVVILIICVVSLLVLYMLFLLCLDPLMSRRPKTYLEQHNEEDTQSVSTERIIEDGGGARPRPGALMSRVKHEVNRVKGEQAKWKGTVSEQRKNIFDRHTMLN